MFRSLSLLSLVAVLSFASITAAEDKAATEQLPAALQAIGAATGDVVTEREAHDVRGHYMYQTKAFSVWGDAYGTINLMEGVLANFKFVQIVPPQQPNDDPSMLVVEGAFGGLEGTIGVNYSGGLSFDFQGKALQESLNFSGMFTQDFFQSYGR
ncbi:MAG: hypothetical protein H8E44_05135 [Planctomycetes bacterium]|nr:hypothetical protein [Planctomycetota bacterium]MBL7037286.1 hypothetical protein [Pirellulaceae bacterium]